MFDDQLEAVSGSRCALADLAAENEQRLREAGCRKLMIAAAWADAHSEVDHPDGGLLVERLVPMGPAGTPAVAETAPAGLVGPFHTSRFSAQSWLGDALSIRHRLPRLWERVVAGEVYAWQAREIAKQTSDLSLATVGSVDADITPWITQLPWKSVLRAVEATIAQVDEVAYQRRETLAAARREVRATQSEHGLRTLIARGEAGDVAMMLALYQRVAECLAEEGDEDPVSVRMSKAIGWVAHPVRLLDLLARHADDPDPQAEPWEQVAAHQADPTDPRAADLPPAGWETERHGNYHQPGLDDDGWWDTCRDDEPSPNGHEHVDWPVDPPVDEEDLAWYHREQSGGEQPREHDGAGQEPATASGDVAVPPADTDGAQPVDALDADDEQGRGVPDHQHRVCSCDTEPDTAITQRWPTVFRPPGWQPLTPAQLAACAPTVAIHVHLSDQTLRDNHGVVRTDTGPILLEQLKRYLVQHDAKIKVYPVIDPAATASVDAYEIPLRLRRAMQIRNPRSVFPHSPTTSRLDLDHMPAYVKDGPPGQTSMTTLGPLARSEHRAVTVGQWQRRQPVPGTYLWRSPEHWVLITTNQGTLDLGHTPYAHHLWNAAA